MLNLSAKGQIKFKQKNFARILKVIRAILPFGARIAERLDMAFGANPDGTITPKEGNIFSWFLLNLGRKVRLIVCKRPKFSEFAE